MKIKTVLFAVAILFLNGYAKTALEIKADMLAGINSEIKLLMLDNRNPTGVLIANIAQKDCVENAEINKYKIKKCRLVFKNTLKYERAKAAHLKKVKAKAKNQALAFREIKKQKFIQ